MDSESRLPNRDELASMFYNRKLLGNYATFYWSSSLESDVSGGTKAWLQYFIGRHHPYPRDGNASVWCIKR